MKKIIFVFLSMVCLAAACGNNQAKNNQNTSMVTQSDGSFQQQVEAFLVTTILVKDPKTLSFIDMQQKGDMVLYIANAPRTESSYWLFAAWIQNNGGTFVLKDSQYSTGGGKPDQQQIDSFAGRVKDQYLVTENKHVTKEQAMEIVKNLPAVQDLKNKAMAEHDDIVVEIGYSGELMPGRGDYDAHWEISVRAVKSFGLPSLHYNVYEKSGRVEVSF